jgi:hypothetical protein
MPILVGASVLLWNQTLDEEVCNFSSHDELEMEERYKTIVDLAPSQGEIKNIVMHGASESLYTIRAML